MAELINIPILKNLIKNEIERNVTDNIVNKLKRLEEENLNDTVEIYGIHDKRLYNKKIRTNYVKKICQLLTLNYKLIVNSDYEKNHIKLKLNDAATAREWQNRSREVRLKNYDLDIDFDAPVKIFVAASPEHKQLLKKTRDALLPHYKYVSLCKKGVMVRQNERSKIYIVKNENDIYDLLTQTTLSSPPLSTSSIIVNGNKIVNNNGVYDDSVITSLPQTLILNEETQI
ncbi:FP/25K [Chrysodeixis includens nucleopolyhedrovirus]|uniref:FP/25K n=1 Tax=Chrysodeixis includens nucleopolyhedrovirus TaxID=1207438 RepID=A0A1C8ZZ08_9ABAC|nr:FP/25K [Chrysodeixis includens nucleopolyhedrovirus]AOL56630.1 FP/25K [Chrysodeixis includens nucleopolyhedrovirus]AOL56771.1 FP/25K [Chrysodeixis includens nucleopolyhedrovirus]AOL56913.1 FP/25K [Chrysodeixis includens nucleopolyhedrovirus]AOL57055.1 FP/25K [Chrysodeixis includens nucleopolyhedrovirus]